MWQGPSCMFNGDQKATFVQSLIKIGHVLQNIGSALMTNRNS